MFIKGEYVSHSVHGAGIICDIEKKEIMGQESEYYVVHIPITDLTIMISREKANESGLRKVVPSETIDEIMMTLRTQAIKMPNNWAERYNGTIKKIKTGDLLQVAEVLRDLYCRDRIKGLSVEEKKMLTKARNIVVSEMTIVKNIERAEAEKVLYSNLEQSFANTN